MKGVPTVALWVKNLTAAAWVTVEAQVQSWPGNFHMPWVQPLIKEKEGREPREPNLYKPFIYYSLCSIIQELVEGTVETQDVQEINEWKNIFQGPQAGFCSPQL